MSRHRMAPGDAAWLHMDRPANRMIISSVMWFDQPHDWALVRELLNERLVARFPRFSQRAVETRTGTWWEDDPSFDLEGHLRHAVLDTPGDRSQLAAYVSGLAGQPLPRDKPLWQITMVDGYDGGGSALVARIHHCVADGVLLSRVLMSLTDDASDAASMRVIDDDPPSALHGLERPISRAATAVLRDVADPGRVLAGARQIVPAARSLARLLTMGSDADTALRGPIGTAKTAAWSAPIPVATLRAAAHAEKATINDLVLAALAGALRSYLARTDGRAADVRAILPVNLREPTPTLPLGLGNEFGLAFLTLPVSCDDPHERVRLVNRRTVALKRSADAVVSLRTLELSGHGRYEIEQLFVAAFAKKASVVVTNVAGPTTAVYLAGRRLCGTTAWPPESGTLALGVSVVSYAGDAVLGVLADDRLIDEPWRLLADLETELARFAAATVGGRS